ncbi:MAG: hypothetical protein AAF702_25685 [Chloroflexota bacterium]
MSFLRLRYGYEPLPSGYARHEGKRVTEEEYWELYYNQLDVEDDATYEWNNGVLEAKPMANRAQMEEY